MEAVGKILLVEILNVKLRVRLRIDCLRSNGKSMFVEGKESVKVPQQGLL